jgi:lysozyme family protein
MSDALVDRLRELQTKIDDQQKKVASAIELLADSDDEQERVRLVKELEGLFEKQKETLSQDPDIKKLLLQGVLGATPLGKVSTVVSLLSGLLGVVGQRQAGDGRSELEELVRDIFTPSPPGHGAAGGGRVTAVAAKSSAPKGSDLLDIAKRHLGQIYRNVRVDYTDPNWKGAFDCAEYASYCAWRAYGILYGARLDPGSGDVPTQKNVEAYTGFWKDDVHSKGIVVSVKEALETPGAFVLRFPPSDGLMGHIGISVGNGKEIYEAHSRNRGVIRNSALGRSWNVGVKLPGVDYGTGPELAVGEKVYRYVEPIPPYDEAVELIQRELSKRGHLSEKDIDGEFGPATRDAVLAFQRVNGLLEDGEVGRETGSALGLGKFWDDDRGVAGSVGEAEEADVAVTEPPLAPVAVPSQLSRSKKYDDLKGEYEALYKAAKVRSNWRKRATDAAEKIAKNKARYQNVAGELGQVPWYFVAVIHNMESTLNFAAHLHNGDPLTGRTFHVPAGRPPQKPRDGGDRYTWEESAIDALKMKKFHALTDWPLAKILYRLELYNGFGYRSYGVPTAYLWSGTQIYDKGKFVADGVWDPTAGSSQVGAATLLKVLEDMGEVRLPS